MSFKYSLSLLSLHILIVIVVCECGSVLVRVSGEWRESPASEKDDPFQFAVVEEVVERPEGARLAEGVAHQVWVV